MVRKQPSVQPVALTLTVLAAFVRLIPHPPNFAPIGGVALFGGARLKGIQAYLVPLLAMLVTDPILSRISGFPAYSAMTPIIYASFMINVLFGRMLIKDSMSPVRIGGVSPLASAQFFAVTNFFVWLGSSVTYSRNVGGLVSCYTAGIPFFGRTVVADLFYCALLFGAHALVTRRWPHSEQQTALAA